jgi:hypothetical protein
MGGEGKRHHADLSSFQKAMNEGCSICSVVMENLRIDGLKQGKLKWGSKPGATNDAGLADSSTSLDFHLYRGELGSNIGIIKLDVTAWSSNICSISRFRLLPVSGK